jgi:ubiquinol-cytochrome c reductase cytochrome c subunit
VLVQWVRASHGSGRRLIRSARRVATLIAVWLTVSVVVGAAPGVGGAGAQDQAADEDEVRRGGGVYMTACAACHGTSALGGVGRGVERGPRLDGLPLAAIDQVVRTGRMPIVERRLGVFTDQLADADRRALLVFMRERFGLEGEIPTVGPGDAARGQELYVRNCAACHGAHTTGGIVGGGTEAPAIDVGDPVAVAEAVRVGPVEMPAFDEEVLDQQQVDDVIAYLQAVDASPRTLLGVREVNDVTAALAAIVLAAAVLVLVSWVGGPPREAPPPPPTAPGGDTWA